MLFPTLTADTVSIFLPAEFTEHTEEMQVNIKRATCTWRISSLREDSKKNEVPGIRLANQRLNLSALSYYVLGSLWGLGVELSEET